MKRAIFTTLVMIFAVYAQTEYPHVQDNGGGYREGAGYQSYASIGQAVIGRCSDGSVVNQAGYLTGLEVYLAIREMPEETKLPEQVVISPAYPNPFNSKCQIEVAMPRAGAISFSVYDLFGRRIHTTREEKPAGTYTVEFDAGNLPSGVYLYKVAAGNITETGRLILVK